ncbi:single-stranded-DNA-specific exonuclease RecJ [Cohnella luojiensis]|uniref:Single-stranded-DNA-specific exonuclease RecJ n=1 Tax=Cohnella luojiensis TaxID=652876 RepID=A0A4Y8M6Z6_9BACL|nr:single-stranded-DNA-specific exonuclease RecJ [Cohnella luojiensis]TFE30731.1 single-stranded-DNA-specific exonuclease RecJ [Cohnella luojiensis]
MIKSKYRWDIPVQDEELVTRLAHDLNVSRLVAGVLVNRGWKSAEQALPFLQADTGDLVNPFLMKGMTEAVERISRAVREGERIRVYGDYDADGVTSTTLMIRLLSELGATFDTYIPHRSREGYGLNLGAIDLASEAGVRLLITVDNGISAVDQIAYAGKLGIDVVVTDHHEPPEIVPDAVALVNPKQKDCPYPFKGLCGAGVVFKLAHAMFGHPKIEYADLAAIGTIADLMPLTGENRIIARLGLEQMRRGPNPGIRALCKVCAVKPEDLTSGRIGFSLAPRLNAGGRLEHADRAVKLLAAAGDEEAELLAHELDKLNVERQALVEQTVIEAEEMWQNQCASEPGKLSNVIVLAKEGWNAGIAGLVASKLVERYYRPTIVLAMDADSGKCKGSARSIDGFDLYAALTECADLMEHYGGHQAAAGMTITHANIAELAGRLHTLAEQWLNAEDWQPKRRIDLSIPLSEITLKAIDQMARLEPFGNGNPTPRILIRDVLIRESRTMGKEDKHLRMTVEQAGSTVEVVAFGMGDQRERLAPGLKIDLLGELSVNEWNGNRKVQAMFQDFRSQHLHLNDRRKERNVWGAVEKLIVNQQSGLAVGCSPLAIFNEAVSRFGPAGIPISAYTVAGIDNNGNTAIQTAATSERYVDRRGEWRHLILIGLPSSDQEVRVLKEWLAPKRGLESVTVFSGQDKGSHTLEPGGASFPERKHFAEVYAMCRQRGQWIDSPDGFIQETAEKTEWPLSTVRMMHEIFIELGFISAEGASRKIVSEPPRRELEESSRYRKARDHAQGLRLTEMTTEELHGWMSSCHVL